MALNKQPDGKNGEEGEVIVCSPEARQAEAMGQKADRQLPSAMAMNFVKYLSEWREFGLLTVVLCRREESKPDPGTGRSDEGHVTQVL